MVLVDYLILSKQERETSAELPELLAVVRGMNKSWQVFFSMQVTDGPQTVQVSLGTPPGFARL